ncbi:MAG: lytic transglycosylase domain-containing protein [Sphingomonas sp.]
MVKATSLFVLLTAAVAAAGQTRSTAPAAPQRPLSIAPVVAVMGQYQAATTSSSAIASAVARWSALRQSDSLPFSSYSSFLISYRGWPGETAMRRTAEARLAVEAVNPRDVLRHFDELPPLTAGGHAQRALALLAVGRRDQALAEAREAWAGGVMPATDEQRLLGGFAGSFTAADHDARLDMLLSSGDRQSAMRVIGYASPARRPIFEARLAMQNRASDASTRLSSVGGAGAGDAGLLIDRANWMRASGDSAGARQLLAQSRQLTTRPANPERFLESLVAHARAAMNDRQWSTAYGIANLVDGIFPPGTDVSERSYGERDEYTNLTWIGGQAALSMGRGADAAAMFDRYGRGAQSSQTRAKGFYWAARSVGERDPRARRWLEQAAASPDQFYGLLALERLGRTPSAPPPGEPPSATDRAALSARPLAEATRYLGLVGRRAEQTLFVRALAQSLRNERERIAAAEFGRMIGRLDMGVWVAREARAMGDSFYVRPAFPEVQIPPAYRHNWAVAHGIMRQESSFDRAAVSSAGARGMMQLMPATAAAEARRLRIPFSASRLTEDPAYNVQLGTHHLTGLMDRFGNNLVLVAVAYNAGPGRVPQWIARNGDPRSPGTDVLNWIEDVPFAETRNYIQRVVENAMIYDLMNPGGSRSQGRVSYFLGQRFIR